MFLNIEKLKTDFITFLELLKHVSTLVVTMYLKRIFIQLETII